jgi:hypothetical protein
MARLFTYNNNEYTVNSNDADPSTVGSIDEIVLRDEYLLHNFINSKGQVFLDIGANCGIATIIFAKQNPDSFL